MSKGRTMRKTREFGGYAARGRPVEQLPRVPPGPAPGYRRHQTSDPGERAVVECELWREREAHGIEANQ